MDGALALAAEGYNLEGREKGYLLAFYPEDKRNPFQHMLYASAFQNGFACFPVGRLDDVALAPDGVKLILHLHWVHRIFDTVETAAAAKAASWQFLNLLDNIQSSGHKLLWTIHNRVSHESVFEEEEYSLRSLIAARADFLHIMNPESASLCAPHYSVPADKTFIVPHPSYTGVYSNYMSRSTARFQLGLGENETVFLLFGKMLPQKGAREFLARLDSLQAAFDGDARILLVGRSSTPEFTEEILGLTAGRPDVLSVRSFVDDQNVQLYFQAADVVMCPYINGLNSGVLMTAASFGKPIVTSRDFKAVFEGIEDHIAFFDTGPGMKGVVQGSLKAAATAKDPEACNTIKAWAESRQPALVSNRFFEALRSRL